VKTAEGLVLPDPDSIVTDVQAASDALYVTAAAGFSRTFYRIRDGGKAVKIEPPAEGTVESFSVDPAHRGGFFKIVGWTRPAEIYRFDPRRCWLRTELQPRPDAAGKLDLTVESVNVRSHDGVEIPLTIIYRRGLKRDSSNPALMIGYGSYAASLDPYFDNVFVPWYEAGGILAFAHVRGGGELGEKWHRAGSKDNKPNTWLDFIACAQYLIDQKFTSPARLAGGGTSAGGILIGRSITERPDLFAAALINVATTDMLRAEYQMNGPANVVEFGTVKEKTSFDQLLEMSAYHHVRDGVHYPAVLLSTGMRDTNVDVWQAAKMAARLQAAKTGRPVLLRVDPESGHDQWGSTRAQIRELRSDQLAFLMWQLDIQNRLR
jgi:prolyl oligopeptidase